MNHQAGSSALCFEQHKLWGLLWHSFFPCWELIFLTERPKCPVVGDLSVIGETYVQPSLLNTEQRFGKAQVQAVSALSTLLKLSKVCQGSFPPPVVAVGAHRVWQWQKRGAQCKTLSMLRSRRSAVSPSAETTLLHFLGRSWSSLSPPRKTGFQSNCKVFNAEHTTHQQLTQLSNSYYQAKQSWAGFSAQQHAFALILLYHSLQFNSQATAVEHGRSIYIKIQPYLEAGSCTHFSD